MQTLELPKSSKILALIAAALVAFALYRVWVRDDAVLLLAVIAVVVSGFLADMFTGLAHFCFDYVFPEKMPILGPIAREFRAHHDHPTLDPSNYPENLTKGAYCSLPLSVVAITLSNLMPAGPDSFTVVATVLGMSFWAYFFHQIHSYAHMGSCLSPDDLHRCIATISGLPSQKQQIQEFAKLFEAVPIPYAIRLLQRYRIILNPEIHNLHHILFETDFSSVNGWSDPILNIFLTPLARRLKARSQHGRE